MTARRFALRTLMAGLAAFGCLSHAQEPDALPEAPAEVYETSETPGAPEPSDSPASQIAALSEQLASGDPLAARSAHEQLWMLITSAAPPEYSALADALLAALPPAHPVEEPTVTSIPAPSGGLWPLLLALHARVEEKYGVLSSRLSTDQAMQVRRELLQLLVLVVQDQHAQPLAELLGDAPIIDDVLAAITKLSPDVAAARLASALPAAGGSAATSIAAALGGIDSPLAVTALKEAVQTGKDELPWSALAALAEQGVSPTEVLPPASLPNFEASARYAGIALKAARRLVEKGQKQQAEAIYARFFSLNSLQHQIRAALLGLGDLQSPQLVRFALGYLNQPRVRQTAVQVLTDARAPQAEEQMLNAYEKGDSAVRSALLEVLSRRNSPGAPALVMQAMQAEDPELRFVGAMLGGAPPAEEDLAYLALRGSTGVRESAMRAYLDLAHTRAISGNTPAAAQQFRNVVDGPFSVPYRREALEGLGQLAQPEDRAIAQDYLTDPWLSATAYGALARITAAQPDQAAAQEALKELARTAPQSTAKAIAVEQLQRLGADTSSFGMNQGYLTQWKVLGPFPNLQKEALTQAFFKEERGDALDFVEYNGVRFQWREAATQGLPAVLDLQQAFGPYNDVAAYAAARISVPQWTPVDICVGADESFVCWLNGKVEFTGRSEQPFQPDNECFPALLKPGVNRILVKILQNQGPWKVSVRLTERAGTPLDLAEQRMPETGVEGVGLGAGAAKTSIEQALP